MFIVAVRPKKKISVPKIVIGAVKNIDGVFLLCFQSFTGKKTVCI